MMERDKELFAREFPQWRVKYVKPDMPFSYLASGGMTLRSLAPRFAFGAVRKVEKWLEPWMRHLAMFALIVLERSGDNEQTGM